VMAEVQACRRTFPNDYVKVNAFDSRHGWESLRLSFLVNRPEREPKFALDRQESTGRMIRYTTQVDAMRDTKGRPA
jgi:ribulose-bisphosphate carboxylase small chain